MLGKISHLQYILIFLVLLVCCISCEKQQKSGKTPPKSTLFKLHTAADSGFDFTNTVENQKDFNIFKYRNFYNGGGVAIGDINNDGLADIYLTANMKPNKLFLNKGNFQFEDITEKAGVGGNKPWSTGVNFVDINADGLLDIYVSNAGNMEGDNHDNDLYINNGDLTFSQKAEKYNLAKTGFSTHATFFDYDKDGDLDAYILNNSNIPVSSLGYAEQRNIRAQDWENIPKIFRGVGDMLLRNDGGKFVDVSEEANIYGSLIGFGLGVVATDFNNDSYPDIYVSNDFYERDYLYINNQDGTFTEAIENWTSHLSLSAMGVDIADINNDGNADVYITEMLPDDNTRVKSVMEFEGYNIFKLKQQKDFYQQYIQNTLQLNNGNGSFSEIAAYSGVESTDWSWSGLLFDMDNDGFRDIYVTNGINHDLTDLDFMDFFANEIIQKMALTGKKEAIDSILNKMPVTLLPNYAYHNNRDLTFTNQAKNWGLGTPSLSNGCAYGDLDNDGDLDLVVNNVNMPSFLYENKADSLTSNNHLKISLKGSKINPFAVGSTIKLYKNDSIIVQELNPSRGFQSSMDYVMTIGLGKTRALDSLRVIWPDDKTQGLDHVEVNQWLTLTHENAEKTYKYPASEASEQFLTEQEIPNVLPHRENNYSDFDYETLVSKMLSQEGPALAVGDINGDGNEDVFIGGSRDQSAQIYLHKANGKLFPSAQKAFETDTDYEDTAAAFFDVDQDGDLDLMVGSGGNESARGQQYPNRLYLNNGNGNFSRAASEIPSVNTNVSVIAPYDFDQDGDVDVFIGSRSVVGTYGINPKHLLLENDGAGNFTDVSGSIGYDLKEAGMVTGAVWAKIDGDNYADLITVADWGAPAIFNNSGKALTYTGGQLENYKGWYSAVEAADLDNDGDIDLVLGNMGTNTAYKASPERPVKLWINDFDNNGSIEQITTIREKNGDYPIHMKKEMTSQLTFLKKNRLKASEYAKSDVKTLFSEEKINNALVKEVTHPESMLAINDGNGNFSMQLLPARVQFSCMCAIACLDINADKLPDLLLAGNDFEFKPQFSRQDASYGNLLLQKDSLQFDWQDYKTSGFFVKNEVKSIKTLHDKSGKTYLILGINDEKPKLYKVRASSDAL